MASNKSKRSSRGRTSEAKLLITAASVAATLSGVAMFATQHTETLAQNQPGVVMSVPAADEANDYPSLPSEESEDDEQAPVIVAPATPTPTPLTGTTQGRRGSRSQQGRPNSLGTTGSSR